MDHRRTRLAAARWGCTVAAVLVILVWGTSGFVGVAMRSLHPTGSNILAVGAGAVQFEGVDMPGIPPVRAFRQVMWQRVNTGIVPAFWWTFEFRRVTVPGMVSRRATFPLWPLALGLSLGAWYLWYRHRRRGFGPGRCSKCGYELAGLTAGAACPECGQPVAL